ncbi:hypothetical protein BJ742DRAFT_807900 [Cladochytrium replicatum]|nr:hypothetical protein BJ742DRAFT_807900 [Cladochytrium replicatum]
MPEVEVAVDCQCDVCKGRRGEEKKQRKPSGKFQYIPTFPNIAPPPPQPPQTKPSKPGSFTDANGSKVSKSPDPPPSSGIFVDVGQPQKPKVKTSPPSKFVDVEKTEQKTAEPKKITPKFGDVSSPSNTPESASPKTNFEDVGGASAKPDPVTPKAVPIKFVDADGSSTKKENPPKKPKFGDVPSKPAADPSPRQMKSNFGDAPDPQQSPKSEGDGSKSGGFLQRALSKLWDAATKVVSDPSPNPPPKFGDVARQPTIPPKTSPKFNDATTQPSGKASAPSMPRKKSFADLSAQLEESSKFSDASSKPQPTSSQNFSKFADASSVPPSTPAGPSNPSKSTKPAPWTDVTTEDSTTIWPSQMPGSPLTPAEEAVGRTIIQANAASLDAAKRLIAIAENDKLPASIRQSAAKAFERTMEGHVSTLGLIDYVKEVYRRRMSQSSNGDRPNIYEFALFAAAAVVAVRIFLSLLRPRKALPASQYYY